MDVRDELIHLYAAYNPKRLKDVDALLERFKGREHAILKSLREKYTKNGAAARLVNESSFTDPSFLFASASSVVDDAKEMSRVASVGSGVQSCELPPPLPPASHRVPALKPVTPSPPSTKNFSSTSLVPNRLLPQRHQDTGTSTLDVPHATVSITPPPSIPPVSASALPFPFHDPGAAAASHGLASAARRAEMQELIRQMTLLDVGQLAIRVEELMRPSASDRARLPLLQWRPGNNKISSSPLTSSARDARGSLPEMLQHTSVFVKFFAECARRYVELAQEEQRYWETQRQPQELTHGTAETATAENAPKQHQDDMQNKNVVRKDLPLPSSPSHTHTVAPSSAKNTNNSSDDTSNTHQKKHKENFYDQPNALSYEAGEPRTLSPPPSQLGRSTSAAAVREQNNTTSPSPSTRGGRRSTSSCVRSIRRARSASPLSTEDVGSPPACRTTTVSPLTSPDGIPTTSERRQRHSGEDFSSPPEPRRYQRSLSHTPPPPPSPGSSPPPPPPGKAPEKSKLRYDDIDIRRSDVRPNAFSIASPPGPLPLPLQNFPGQLTTTQAEHRGAKRVLHWSPAAGEANRYGQLCSTLESGDCVVLQPGVYYENLRCEHCGRVELTSAYPGAAVVLRPFSDLEPVLSVSGAGTQVKLTGIVLVEGEVSNEEEGQQEDGHRLSTGVVHGGGAGSSRGKAALGRPAVPLLSVRDGAEVTATASHFYGATGGGIDVVGRHTRLQLDLCLISLCRFAGVYIHGGASADITQSKIKKSEVGLRVLQGSFYVSETTFEDNKSDGIVVYEESMGVLERSNVFNNGGNGIFLSGGTELRVAASTIELNALYGVQRTPGSTLHIKSSFVRDNGLLPINDELQ